MLALICAIVFAAALVLLRRSTGFYVFFALAFLLFGFVWRMTSVVYVGGFGPVYAEHLQSYIGDVGGASLVFTASILIVLGGAALILSPKALSARTYPAARYRVDEIARLAFLSMSGFVFVLYVDMLWRGVIPLFSFMERDVYSDEYAGIFHKLFFEFNFMFSFMLGFFFVRPRLQGGAYDLRYLGVLIALYVYLLLVGHRFSAFFTVTTFFIIPIAAVQAHAKCGKLGPSADPEQLRRVLRLAKSAAPIIALILVGLIGFALYNSVYNVRGYSDPVEYFTQRILVQPTELWWVTWESSIINGQANPGLAYDMMFVNPIDGTRNTGIQFLMAQAVGYERASELLFLGEQYNGGYPEVLFELLGPIWAWPAMIGFATLLVWFLRLVVIAVITQRIGTAIFSVFLFYGLSVLYLGGMLNFVLTWTLYVKIGLLIGFLLYERPPVWVPAGSPAKAPSA